MPRERVRPARNDAHELAASRPTAETIPIAVMASIAPPSRSLPQIWQTGFSLLGIAITGPWSTGNGGVFLSLCNIMSSARATFLPSTMTSKEKLTNSALPLILFEATPPPALPASSPVLVLKLESFKQIGLPSHFTLELPDAVSDDFATFG